MDILNVMWQGGSAFVSVHNVHRDILRLSPAGAQIDTLLLQGGDAAPLLDVGSVSALGLSSTRIKGRGFSACRRWFDRRRLARWISRQQPRLVLLDGMGVAAYVLPLLHGLTDTRAIVLFHGHKCLKSADVDLLRRFPADRLKLVAVSKTLAADLERQTGCPVVGGRIALDPSRVRTSLLSRSDARSALGLPVATGNVIGGVGRLVREKGFGLLIEAAGGWLKAHPEDCLVLIGDGPEREGLISLAKSMGISQQVRLLGHVANASCFYRAFDLLCIPSREEGLGLVLPEAVIAGVPVLATHLPVFREQLRGEYGLVSSAEKADWEAALSHCLRADLNRLAEEQWSGMDPEHAWLSFLDLYRALMRFA
ncbi:hypothetical protein A7D27_19665 [Pseudomonas sp. 1D4]|uniref:glycosyltransferase n=1 Tax=Pseudomonas sp. 1D4 TaxID=1843691 RepID=UPI00084B1E4F|nr:glycosyltransferase [Pseudomonas sp. 1D4]OEC39144.1 hypothetical protein A7D27_19665 [Pseudomonas sp. 1D4]